MNTPQKNNSTEIPDSEFKEVTVLMHPLFEQRLREFSEATGESVSEIVNGAVMMELLGINDEPRRRKKKRS